MANAGLAPVLEREKLTAYPARPSLTNVARFQFFREQGDRVAGVWLVRLRGEVEPKVSLHGTYTDRSGTARRF